MAELSKVASLAAANIAYLIEIGVADIAKVWGLDWPAAGGDRGIIGGGITAVGSVRQNIIDYITISSASDATNFGDLSTERGILAATSNGASGRGVFGGGHDGDAVNLIEYVTILSIGNTTDFGDLPVERYGLAGTSNGTNERGIFGGGLNQNIINYITINSASNATDFGDLTINRYTSGATSNATSERGIFAATGTASNTIDYITISSTGDATDFGDLTVARIYINAATSNGTSDRGIIGGGRVGANSVNTIDYITISSAGDATTFGDLTVINDYLSATSNGTTDRGVFCGGYNNQPSNSRNVIDYVTISSAGDATDFGDLTVDRFVPAATSNA